MEVDVGRFLLALKMFLSMLDNAGRTQGHEALSYVMTMILSIQKLVKNSVA